MKIIKYIIIGLLITSIISILPIFSGFHISIVSFLRDLNYDITYIKALNDFFHKISLVLIINGILSVVFIIIFLYMNKPKNIKRILHIYSLLAIIQLILDFHLFAFIFIIKFGFSTYFAYNSMISIVLTIITSTILVYYFIQEKRQSNMKETKYAINAFKITLIISCSYLFIGLLADTIKTNIFNPLHDILHIILDAEDIIMVLASLSSTIFFIIYLIKRLQNLDIADKLNNNEYKHGLIQIEKIQS